MAHSAPCANMVMGIEAKSEDEFTHMFKHVESVGDICKHSANREDCMERYGIDLQAVAQCMQCAQSLGFSQDPNFKPTDAQLLGLLVQCSGYTGSEPFAVADALDRPAWSGGPRVWFVALLVVLVVAGVVGLFLYARRNRRASRQTP